MLLSTKISCMWQWIAYVSTYFTVFIVVSSQRFAIILWKQTFLLSVAFLTPFSPFSTVNSTLFWVHHTVLGIFRGSFGCHQSIYFTSLAYIWYNYLILVILWTAALRTTPQSQTYWETVPATCSEVLVRTGFESLWSWSLVAVPVVYLTILNLWLAWIKWADTTYHSLGMQQRIYEHYRLGYWLSTVQTVS